MATRKHQGKRPPADGGYKASRTRFTPETGGADANLDEREIARRNQKPRSSRATPRGPAERK